MSNYSFSDVIGEFKVRLEEVEANYVDYRQRRLRELQSIVDDGSSVFDKRKKRKERQAMGEITSLEGHNDYIFKRLSEGVSIATIAKEIGYRIPSVHEHLMKHPVYLEKYYNKRKK